MLRRSRRGNRAPARIRIGAVIGIAAALSGGSVFTSGPVVGAQGGTTTTTSTTTTTIEPETTTTSVPDETTTSVPDEVTTPTNTIVPPIDPTAPALDEFSATGEGASTDAADRSTGYAGQLPFDVTSKAVLTADLGLAHLALLGTQRQLVLAQLAAQQLTAKQQELAARVALSGLGSRQAIDDAFHARDLLRRRAVAAYVGTAPSFFSLFGVVDQPADYTVAHEYMQRMADEQRGAVQTLEDARSKLSDQDQALADEQAALAGRLQAATDLVGQTSRVMVQQQGAVDALEAGSHVTVAGFMFPVAGEVVFSDGWGAPRLMGTPQAHWHEGCDIMAPLGRELVAAEDGVLSRVGFGALGGNSVSVTGLSGTRYYYAHLSAFVPDLVEGATVTAGQLIGYVGNTGDAAGGPTHLHFEIHPGGGAAVDPYPLLRVTYDARRRAELASLAHW